MASYLVDFDELARASPNKGLHVHSRCDVFLPSKRCTVSFTRGRDRDFHAALANGCRRHRIHRRQRKHTQDVPNFMQGHSV
jgi:hypothetical protein